MFDSIAKASQSGSRAKLERTPTITGLLPTAVGDRMKASEMASAVYTSDGPRPVLQECA